MKHRKTQRLGLGEIECDVWDDRREVESRKDQERFLLDVGLSWLQRIFLLVKMSVTETEAVIKASPD